MEVWKFVGALALNVVTINSERKRTKVVYLFCLGLRRNNERADMTAGFLVVRVVASITKWELFGLPAATYGSL